MIIEIVIALSSFIIGYVIREAIVQKDDRDRHNLIKIFNQDYVNDSSNKPVESEYVSL